MTKGRRNAHGSGAGRLTLADGTALEIRQIEPDDKHALAEGFARLSPTSRYLRFLSPIDHLTDSSLAYLTEVDHHDHEALVAFVGEAANRRGSGASSASRATRA